MKRDVKWFVCFWRRGRSWQMQDYYTVTAETRAEAVKIGREYLQSDYGLSDSIKAKLMECSVLP